MNEFAVMKLPHADEYVELVQLQKRLDLANLKFNEFYCNPNCKPKPKLVTFDCFVTELELLDYKGTDVCEVDVVRNE